MTSSQMSSPVNGIQTSIFTAGKQTTLTSIFAWFRATSSQSTITSTMFSTYNREQTSQYRKIFSTKTPSTSRMYFCLSLSLINLQFINFQNKFLHQNLL
jgi:hypothetical protein